MMNKIIQSLPNISETIIPDGCYNLSRNENFLKPEIDFDFELNLNKYTSTIKFKEILAEKFFVEPYQIIFGTGSNDILRMCVNYCCGENKIIQIMKKMNYPFQYLIKTTGAKLSYESGESKFIVNPNNPTGEFVNKYIGDFDYDT